MLENGCYHPFQDLKWMLPPILGPLVRSKIDPRDPKLDQGSNLGTTTTTYGGSGCWKMDGLPSIYGPLPPWMVVVDVRKWVLPPISEPKMDGYIHFRTTTTTYGGSGWLKMDGLPSISGPPPPVPGVVDD